MSSFDLNIFFLLLFWVILIAQWLRLRNRTPPKPPGLPEVLPKNCRCVLAHVRRTDKGSVGETYLVVTPSNQVLPVWFSKENGAGSFFVYDLGCWFSSWEALKKAWPEIVKQLNRQETKTIIGG